MKRFLSGFSEIIKTFKLLRRTLSMLWQAAPIGMSGLTFIVIVQAVIPAATIYLTKLTVDSVTSLATGAEGLSVLLLSLLWLAVLLADPIITIVNQALQGFLAEKFTAFINLKLIDKAEAMLGLGVLEDKQYYDDLNYLKEGVKRRPLNVIVLSVLTIRDILSLIGISLILIPLAWWIPIVLIAAAIPYGMMLIKLRNLEFQATIGASSDSRAMNYNSEIALNYKYAQEARLFGLFPWLRQRYQSHFQELHQRMNGVRRKEATRGLPTSLPSIAVTAGLFAWAIYQAAQGRLTAGEVVALLQAVGQTRLVTSNFAQDAGFLFERLLFFNHYFSFIEAEPGIKQPETPLAPSQQNAHDITFEGVTFSYPDGRPALKDVSFHITAGETVALVGENGAGKTTIVKLLLRFYDPSEGRILINGTDLKDLDLLAWRKQIGAVFQDFNHYDYSLRENVVLADLEGGHDEVRLDDVLHKAGIMSVVKQLSQGLETQLGKEFGGTELSGGQWQKLAIARVLFRNASLLILDEPTAALDPRSEYEIFKTFSQLASEPTTLMVTHRLSSVPTTDRVLVLKDGQLLEDGTHTSLLALEGEYAQLWTMQAENYQDKALPVY